jgi:hypothetical protein
MRRSLQGAAYGKIALCLLTLPLVARMPSRYGAQPHTATPPWNLPWPSTTSQTAMREASAWWVEAVQLAADETDEAHVVLQTWDPNAPSDIHEELVQQHRFLAADHGGYVERALAAVRRAERLAQTSAERARAERHRRIWESAAQPAASRAGRTHPFATTEPAPRRAAGPADAPRIETAIGPSIRRALQSLQGKVST